MKPRMDTRFGTLGALILMSVVVVMYPAASAQNLDRSAEDHNKQLVLKSFNAWTAGYGSPFDLLAEHASWTIAGNSVVSRTYNSREDFLSQVIRPFNSRMSDYLKSIIHSIYADGNTVVVYFDANGTALDGKPYHNTYAWFFDFRDDKIIRAVAFFDSLEFNDFWTRVKPVSDIGRK